MSQHRAGAAANAPGTGLEYRDPALPWPLAERAGWTVMAELDRSRHAARS